MKEWIEVSGSVQDIYAINLAFPKLTNDLGGYPSFKLNGEQPTVIKVDYVLGHGPKLLRLLGQRIRKMPLSGKVAMEIRSSK